MLFSFKYLTYGLPNRNWVSISRLLYQGSQNVVSSWLLGSAIISEKLVLTPSTL